MSLDQVPFGDLSTIIDNPEPRCPCLLLLDTSGSMGGDPIRQLNTGILTFKDELMADALAVKRVEIGIIGFGPVSVLSEFQTPDMFTPPTISASGDTPMGAAITMGIEMVRSRKDFYKQVGLPYYRPWIFLITDGGPTDAWQAAAQQIREGEAQKAFQFFAVGVKGADMDKLRQISVREPLMLDGLRFRDLFSWLSASLQSVSQSQVGETVALPSPNGWTSVG